MRDLRQHGRQLPPPIVLLCAAIALGRPNVCVEGFVHHTVRSAYIAAGSSFGCNSCSGRASSAVRVRSTEGRHEARHKARKAMRHGRGGLMSNGASPSEITSENARCAEGTTLYHQVPGTWYLYVFHTCDVLLASDFGSSLQKRYY
ncbi:unnamed protein product [Laminaria digitata]